MKKVFRKIHLWLSVPFGLLITLICFSGAMLVFDDNEIPVFYIGGGSNLLVSDFGIRGAVIQTGGFSDITLLDGCEIECGAGVKLAQLCSFAFEHSLAGIEFAWGIPGTVGGAVYMNAGAYGGEMKDVYPIVTIFLKKKSINKYFWR